MIAPDGFGLQVSEQRIDDLDRLAVQHASAWALPPVRALDLGCGSGTVSALLAEAGARVTAVDCHDHADAVRQRACRLAPGAGSLFFLQMTLPDGLAAWLAQEPRWQLFYSQRMLHYLVRSQALRLLSLLRQHGAPRAGLFLGVSGMASELSNGYEGLNQSVEDRFGRLSPTQRGRHLIDEPVCLYTADELAALVEEAGFEVQQVWCSTFGNVKLAARLLA